MQIVSASHTGDKRSSNRNRSRSFLFPRYGSHTYLFQERLQQGQSGNEHPLLGSNGSYWHKCEMSTGSEIVCLSGAGSTGRRNTGVKSLCRGLKFKGLTWSFV